MRFLIVPLGTLAKRKGYILRYAQNDTAVSPDPVIASVSEAISLLMNRYLLHFISSDAARSPLESKAYTM